MGLRLSRWATAAPVLSHGRVTRVKLLADRRPWQAAEARQNPLTLRLTGTTFHTCSTYLSPSPAKRIVLHHYLIPERQNPAAASTGS